MTVGGLVPPLSYFDLIADQHLDRRLYDPVHITIVIVVDCWFGVDGGLWKKKKTTTTSFSWRRAATNAE